MQNLSSNITIEDVLQQTDFTPSNSIQQTTNRVNDEALSLFTGDLSDIDVFIKHEEIKIKIKLK